MDIYRHIQRQQQKYKELIRMQVMEVLLCQYFTSISVLSSTQIILFGHCPHPLGVKLYTQIQSNCVLISFSEVLEAAFIILSLPFFIAKSLSCEENIFSSSLFTTFNRIHWVLTMSLTYNNQFYFLNFRAFRFSHLHCTNIL